MKIFEYYDEEREIYIITEYLKGGNIYERLISQNTFSDYQAAILMSQILSAVYYCHSKNIVHR